MSTTSRKRRRQIDRRRRRREDRRRTRERVLAPLLEMRWKIMRQRREHMRLAAHPRIMLQMRAEPGFFAARQIGAEEVRLVYAEPVDAEAFKRRVDEETWLAAADVGSLRQAHAGQEKGATATYLLGMLGFW